MLYFGNSPSNYVKSLNVHLVAGIFFVLPCIESYQKVDLRTITLGVPPQEVPPNDGMMVMLMSIAMVGRETRKTKSVQGPLSQIPFSNF